MKARRLCSRTLTPLNSEIEEMKPLFVKMVYPTTSSVRSFCLVIRCTVCLGRAPEEVMFYRGTKNRRKKSFVLFFFQNV